MPPMLVIRLGAMMNNRKRFHQTLAIPNFRLCTLPEIWGKFWGGAQKCDTQIGRVDGVRLECGQGQGPGGIELVDDGVGGDGEGGRGVVGVDGRVGGGVDDGVDGGDDGRRVAQIHGVLQDLASQLPFRFLRSGLTWFHSPSFVTAKQCPNRIVLELERRRLCRK